MFIFPFVAAAAADSIRFWCEIESERDFDRSTFAFSSSSSLFLF
jgi:hypothetical protein